MTGNVKNLVEKKGFGFIRAEGKEYFFHKDDFKGHWDDLVDDHKDGQTITMEFEVVQSAKGPRASNVRRTDYPNQSV